MRLVGLEIDSDRFRAVIVERAWRRVAVIATEEFTPLPSAEADIVTAVSDALMRYKAEHGISGVVIGLDMTYFSNYFVELPLRKPDEIRSALGFEMEKHLPLPPEEYLFDHATVSEEGGRTRNLVFALRRERVRPFMEAVRIAGVRLVSVRSSMLDVMSEFMATYNTQDVLFVYEERDTVGIAGLRGFTLADLRVVRKGKGSPETVIREMTDAYSRGTFHSGPGSTLIENALTDVTRYHRNASEVIVAGSRPKGGLGLAFLPVELEPEGRDLFPWIAGTLACIAVMLYVLTVTLAYYKDQAALKDIRAKMAGMKNESVELVAIRNELEGLRKRQKFIAEFQARRNRNIDVLRQLSVLLPREAYLMGFSVDDKGLVEIQGYAKRSADLIPQLRQSSMFNSIEFASQVTVAADKERFSLRMEIKKQ